MPTVYNKALSEGDQSFEDFMIGIARNHGLMGFMREEPFEAGLPDKIEVPQEIIEQIFDYEELIPELESRTPEQIVFEWERKKAADIKSLKAQIKNRTDIVARARAMRVSIINWEPPTEHHEMLVKIALDQTGDLIDEMSGIASLEAQIREINNSDPLEMHNAVLVHTKRELKRLENQLGAEKVNTKAKTDWIQALKSSLK